MWARQAGAEGMRISRPFFLPQLQPLLPYHPHMFSGLQPHWTWQIELSTCPVCCVSVLPSKPCPQALCTHHCQHAAQWAALLVYLPLSPLGWNPLYLCLECLANRVINKSSKVGVGLVVQTERLEDTREKDQCSPKEKRPFAQPLLSFWTWKAVQVLGPILEGQASVRYSLGTETPFRLQNFRAWVLCVPSSNQLTQISSHSNLLWVWCRHSQNASPISAYCDQWAVKTGWGSPPFWQKASVWTRMCPQEQDFCWVTSHIMPVIYHPNL